MVFISYYSHIILYHLSRHRFISFYFILFISRSCNGNRFCPLYSTALTEFSSHLSPHHLPSTKIDNSILCFCITSYLLVISSPFPIPFPCLFPIPFPIPFLYPFPIPISLPLLTDTDDRVFLLCSYVLSYRLSRHQCSYPFVCSPVVHCCSHIPSTPFPSLFLSFPFLFLLPIDSSHRHKRSVQCD